MKLEELTLIAKEKAHDFIESSCKIKYPKCDCPFPCNPERRKVTEYHTRCRSKFQAFRDGYIQGVNETLKEAIKTE